MVTNSPISSANYPQAPREMVFGPYDATEFDGSNRIFLFYTKRDVIIDGGILILGTKISGTTTMTVTYVTDALPADGTATATGTIATGLAIGGAAATSGGAVSFGMTTPVRVPANSFILATASGSTNGLEALVLELEMRYA